MTSLPPLNSGCCAIKGFKGWLKNNGGDPSAKVKMDDDALLHMIKTTNFKMPSISFCFHRTYQCSEERPKSTGDHVSICKYNYHLIIIFHVALSLPRL